ncbi:hypothetical protein LCGC14_1841090 [marine sediment metagenome]|uniref:Glycosyltransferase family 9 (Heptosyltransferase) n=1 Tax=marine sediment metagenome TaxID=412755 RepID=A0A0F9GD97_9ZZZZ
MAHRRLLFCTGEGIGNVIQTIPVIRTLKEVLGYEVDFWHAFGFYTLPTLIPYVDNWFTAGAIRDINPNDYVGKVSTFWTRQHINMYPVKSIKLLNEIKPLTMDRSEVDTYMDIVKDAGEGILWNGECNSLESKNNYDVVIHNGYKKQDASWKIKEYPHYEAVAKMLVDKGLNVCSVGSKEEYVEGTVNKTGLTLLSSLGVIKSCKVFLSNDSGLYHCANALEVPNVVIFTATSIKKNYDKRFHRYTTIIGRDDLECRPCQKGRRWLKDCKTWDCQQVDPQVVYEAVMEKKLKEEKKVKEKKNPMKQLGLYTAKSGRMYDLIYWEDIGLVEAIGPLPEPGYGGARGTAFSVKANSIEEAQNSIILKINRRDGKR